MAKIVSLKKKGGWEHWEKSVGGKSKRKLQHSVNHTELTVHELSDVGSRFKHLNTHI